MNELVKVFDNEQFGQIRTIVVDGKVWFVASDIAKALAYTNTSKAINSHCRCITKRYIPHPQGNGTLEVNTIPEGDIVRLIVIAANQSQSETIREKAEKFESWIFDEVIPTVLKTGSYQAPTQYEIPHSFAEALQLAADLQAEKERNAPLVAYASAVSAGNDCVTVGTVAKIIEQKYHVNIGQNRLFEKMRADGILMKAPKGHKDHNRPKQHYIECGWFVLNGSQGSTPDGSKSWESFTPYVTPKGRIALVDKYGRQVAEKRSQQTELNI